MDQRSKVEKVLWDWIGPPLYYCSECLRVVKVTTGEKVEIKKVCSCNAEVYAPRRAIMVGKGGANFKTKCLTKWSQIKAAVTGRDC